MEKEKVCPLMAMANGIRKNAYAPYCLKEQCAWWDKALSECSVTALVGSIDVISEYFQNKA